MISPPPKLDLAAPAASRRRERWFWILTVTLLPTLALALLELGLRLAGYGYPTCFFVNHPAAPSDSLVENQRFSWRFFERSAARYPRPVVVSRHKPPGTHRIFVFGESAAQGDPDPVFSFARILQALLSERYSGVRFEVINVAFTAINSHVLLPTSRECASMEGDLWLVYMGHNEVVGPFGAGSPFGRKSPPLPVVRASLALKATRIGQLLAHAGEKLLSLRGSRTGWAGMTMMLGHQVRQDDPGMNRIHGHFQQNLEDLLRSGRQSGARVVVSTLVSNLKDCPPFASLHRPDLNEAERSAWEQTLRDGVAAEAAGQFDAALAKYEEASRIDAAFAELHFRRGRCALSLGQLGDAKAHFKKARDLDTLRFRADDRLNEIIRDTVKNLGAPEVRLLDAEAEFSGQSKHGIPGDEWLYEHVHFNFEGNYLLARLFADQVASLLPESLTGSVRRPDPWMSESEAAQRLAWNDYSRYWAKEHIRQRLVQPPFTGQLGHGERLQRWEADLIKLQPRIKSTGLNRAASQCRAAISQASDDWGLQDLLAFLLANLGDSDGALAEWRRVSERVPHFATPYCEAGKTFAERNETDQAIAMFTRALAVNPDYAEAHFNLSLIYAKQGRRTEAIRHFREAIRLDPANHPAKQSLQKLLREVVLHFSRPGFRCAIVIAVPSWIFVKALQTQLRHTRQPKAESEQDQPVHTGPTSPLPAHARFTRSGP